MVFPTLEEITARVEREIQQIADPLAQETLRSRLIKPVLQTRKWFYTEDTDPVWAVAEDLETDTCYVYGEAIRDDEGNPLPWGLVLITELDMGMDSYWSQSLETIFYDSWVAAPLPIWNVIKCGVHDEKRVIASSLTTLEAEAFVEKLNAEYALPFHSRTVFAVEPRMFKWGP
jgi:hypothetical protein